MNVEKRVSGDKTYVYDPRKNRLVVLFYKSPVKSLLSLCITAVLSAYCQADALKLKLSKAVYQLLKYYFNLFDLLTVLGCLILFAIYIVSFS